MFQPDAHSFSRAAPIYRVLGIPISQVTLPRVLGHVQNWSRDSVGRYICFRDVASLMACRKDPALVAVNEDAALVCPDGVPLVWAARARGLEVERACGPDFFDFACANGRNLRHYLYGGKQGVAEDLAQLCRDRYPGIRIVGTECPPFRPLTAREDAAVVARIRASGADVVWVGLSSPKQDVWMRNHVDRLPQTLIGVGAAFDFHAGTVRRAPRWMRTSGLEWLHRFLSEPRRLWKRYLLLAPKFVFLMLYYREWGRTDGDRTKPINSEPKVL